MVSRSKFVPALTALVLTCALVCALWRAAGAGSAPERWSEDWCEESQRNDHRSHACEVRDLPEVQAPAVLSVDAGPNGGVEVAAGDAKAISGRVKIEAWADTGEEARALLAQVRIVPTATGFEAQGPEPPTRKHGAWWNATFRIEAGEKQALDLETMNGPLAVYGMSGRTVLHSENGPIAIVRCGGDMLVRATNGPVSVDLGGTTWNGRGLDARAENGPVALSVPKDFDADLEFGTINGPWSGPSTAFAARHGGYAHARLGKGGKPISVTTENGPFALNTVSR